MRMKYFYSPEDLEELPEPKDDGLKNEFGFLFYHYLPIEMSTKQKEYMKKLDIEINNSHKFTEDEDNILMENWRKYREFYDRKYNKRTREHFSLIGFRCPCIKFVLFRQRLSTTKNLNTWPKLCEGLDNRTAVSIQRRLSLIIDNNYQPGCDEPSEEQLEQIKKIEHDYNISRLRKLCEKAKIPFLFFAMYKPTEKKEKTNNKKKKKKKINPCLFNDVLKLSKISEVDFATVLSKLKSTKIHQMIEKSEMDWKKLKEMNKSENYSKEEWDLLVDRLVEVYRNNMMENEKKGIYSEYTWLMTKKIVFSQMKSLSERLCFIRCLYKCINPEAIFLEENDAFDKHKLREKLSNLGFRKVGSSEDPTKCITYQQLVIRFKTLEDEVFHTREPKLNLKEKLMVYFESFMRQSTKTGLTTDIHNTRLVEVVRKVADEYYTLKHLSGAKDIEKLEVVENEVNRKRRFVESPILKRLKIRVLTEEEKNSVRIPRTSNHFNESHHSSSADESTFIDLSGMDTTRNSASFLRPDETVLAGGGERAEEQNVEDSFFESSIQDEFSSRIIEIPVHIKKETPKPDVIIPKEPVSNWLDLLG